MKTQILIIVLLFTGLVSSAQNGKQSIDEVFDLLKKQQFNSYFEVSEEMFKMLSESKYSSPEYKDYVKKLTGMKMIKKSDRKADIDIYKIFMNNANLHDFTKLMSSETHKKKITFMQKKGNPNQYLLIESNAIIYISGTLDLKSISEFERVMEIAGSAFEM